VVKALVDGKGEDPPLFRLFHDGDGVRGLARLGDEDEHVVLSHDRVPVPELGGDVDVDGDAQVFLEHVLADETCMVGSAARDHPYASDLVHGRELQLLEVHLAPLFLHPAEERIGDGPRLLEDLLQHEMLVAALLRHGARPVEDLHLPLHPVSFSVQNKEIAPLHDCKVVVFQEDEPVGPPDKGRRIARDEELPVAYAEHEGALLFRGNEGLLGLLDNAEGVRAVHLP